MKTGFQGLRLIRRFEGLRLEAYEDEAGIWTIGYGHTAQAGPPNPKAGMRLTRKQADDLLADDLTQYETAVENALARAPSQVQFDAMVSLCFNIGPGNFNRSGVIRAFNDGRTGQAAQAFLAWNKAKGRVLPGLTRRRQAERRLFLSADGTTPAKWALAGAGSTLGGTLVAGAADSFASSFGFGLSTLDWRGLLVVGGLIGLMAMAALWAMGEERRERLWDRVFG